MYLPRGVRKQATTNTTQRRGSHNSFLYSDVSPRTLWSAALCGVLFCEFSHFVKMTLCLDLWSLLLTLSISIEEDCLHDCTCIPLFFSFLFLWSLLLSSSTRRRFSPQRSSGQAVVTGVVPSLPRYVPSIFIPHRVQHSHCSSILIECC